MEVDQVDILPFTVLGNFKQIDHAEETRLPCELWGDVRQAYRFDGVDLDVTFLHPVTAACCNPWTGPETDSRGDLSTPDSFTQALGEGHWQLKITLFPCRRDATFTPITVIESTR